MNNLLIIIVLLIIIAYNLTNVKNENFDGMTHLEGLLRMVSNPYSEKLKLKNYSNAV